jgi:KDO2-lipid IV(A) lauroyltransferase
VLRALDAGRGAILLTPHLGAFELSPRAFAIHRPITVLYRPARQRLLRNMMEALRPTQNLLTAPADASGVRMLLRALRRGEAIGMLPDQVPAQGEGLWAPFFSRPAYTMVLPIRLAQTTGAPIFWVITVRTASGWRMEFEPWTPEVSLQSDTVEHAVAAMNEALEVQIARAPEQYLWAYNRYKIPHGIDPPARTLGQ